MAKKEVKTDLWVHDLLKEAGIKLDAQGSEVKEIDKALKTASKRGTGKVGFPEYVGIVKDFIIVIEDKPKLENHVKYDSNKLISLETKDVVEFAVNGALFYAKHLIQNTTYKKVFAFGVSGNEKNHRITPLFVDDRQNLFDQLEDVESFISFNEKNIDEYYLCDVLKESSDKEKELEEILADAKVLHEHLRNYGNMKDEEKPLVVSGILLALRERDHGNFSIDSLNGDTFVTDGQKIYNAIESSFKRTDLSPITKIDKILSQFAIIKDSTKLNEKNATLGETPLKFFAKFLDEKLYKSIKYTRSAEDYLGRFYGEFMRYSGGSGQTLGIVLTPRHITELFCDLLDLKTTDRIFDPCCGTGGFLVAALHKMLSQSTKESEQQHIRKNQLFGIELRPDMFTVATTNMILRGDGKSNLHCDDFLAKNPKQLQTDFRATVGMLNPPYSQGTKKDPSLYEIAFTEHLLDSLLPNSRCAVIVPQSSMTGKSKEEQQIKNSILKKHTLEGTIMLQKDTFYGIGVIPCIAVFTAGVPHDKEKICKFVNFEDDGFKVSPHIGLLETESAKDKKQHLLDVWFNRIEAPTKFCVKTTITAEDEWLHSFYYFNDEIPTDKDFEKTVGDYLTFEFSMIMQGRKYLFEDDNNSEKVKKNFKKELTSRDWKESKLTDIFEIKAGKRLVASEMKQGERPFIGASDSNNGITNFVSNENKSLDKNVLGVNYNGSVVENFYHPYECIFSDDVKRFHLRNWKDNKFSLLFMKTNILQQKSKFLYAYKFNENRMRAQNIILPVTSKGEIDYNFMESYIKELEDHKIKEYREFATKRLNECKDNAQAVEQLEEKEWKPFFIKDLFQEVQRGKRLIKENQKSGFVPYISSSAMNNGVDNYISNDTRVRKFGNCLSLANSGSVGSCFYEPFEFVASDHITHLKNTERNKFQYLFEATLLNRLSEKYNFNREINDVRISKEIILLPVDSAGNPDYAYMESYIKNLMAQKYAEYLEFKK
ncbi:restriction endonuclease subunit S [bacterium]|nr:restriction endonuclease subunit S [bacterium]